jgi:hypothetical protein
MEEFKVGDKVFLASFRYEEKQLVCPACFGKLQLKVILGNDEEVIVPCNSCDRGYLNSTGYITESEWTPKVEEVVIQKIDAEETLEGRKVERYFYNYNWSVCPDDNKLFKNKEDAEKRVAELIEEHELNKKESIKRKKQEPIKTYGWHVRYHSREIKELERKLEYHKTKLIICKSHDKKSAPNELR